MSICCECCLSSGRGLCDELITRPEKYYRLWCVVCVLETSRMRRLGPLGAVALNKRGGGTVPGEQVHFVRCGVIGHHTKWISRKFCMNRKRFQVYHSRSVGPECM
jgi:hypothetical protein